MTTVPISTAPTSTAPTAGRLYLIRAALSLGWAGLLTVALAAAGSMTPQESIPAFAFVLLVIYPLIDVVASLVDVRASRRSAPGNATTQLINAAISTVAVAAVAISAQYGADMVLRAFGTWALLTGVIQLILAVTRRRRGVGGQLPMILSGSISSVAGIGFIVMATGNDLDLRNLAAYAAAGAVFFILSAWRLRSRRPVGSDIHANI